MATSAQVKSFLSKVVPLFQKYGAQYKFHIISFAIAQACLESGYGTSVAAKDPLELWDNIGRNYKRVLKK